MIYELYGRLAEEKALVSGALEQEIANHRATVAILGQVASGEIPIDRVSVMGHDWRVAPVIVPENHVGPPALREG